MADTKTAVAHEPIWIDLSSTDAAGARDFYARLFGWKVEANPDPQYGGYAVATLGGKDVAGIGPAQSPEGPSAWMVYIGARDAADIVKKAAGAGGKAVMEPMQVGPQGKMAIVQDPSGAFVGIWEPGQMKGAGVTMAPGAYSWAELNSRGFDKASAFYQKLFGWSEKRTPMGEGLGDYTEFQLNGKSIGGGMEMNSMVPAQVPSYWMVYFGVGDVDKAFEKAKSLGATEMLPPTDFPGGRFAIVADPQGAAFGLLKADPRQGGQP